MASVWTDKLRRACAAWAFGWIAGALPAVASAPIPDAAPAPSASVAPNATIAPKATPAPNATVVPAQAPAPTANAAAALAPNPTAAPTPNATIAPAPAPAPAKSGKAAPPGIGIAPVLTPQDSLFIAAATGEPRFQRIRDSAEKILVAGDTTTLDYLLAHRLTGQTPRQRHYVETLFKAISDSGRHPSAAARLGAALPAAPDSLKPQLLHIGSELGDSSFLKFARLYLHHDSEEVRKNAVRSLGSYPSPDNAAWLIAGLDKTRDLERAERLWALGKQKSFKEWPKVLPILRDSNLYNRELARRIVAASCGDWSNVEKLAPSPMDDDELLEWVLMAEESPGLSAKIWVRKNVPTLSPARMKFIGSALRLQ